MFCSFKRSRFIIFPAVAVAVHLDTEMQTGNDIGAVFAHGGGVRHAEDHLEYCIANDSAFVQMLDEHSDSSSRGKTPPSHTPPDSSSKTTSQPAAAPAAGGNDVGVVGLHLEPAPPSTTQGSPEKTTMVPDKGGGPEEAHLAAAERRSELKIAVPLPNGCVFSLDKDGNSFTFHSENGDLSADTGRVVLAISHSDKDMKLSDLLGKQTVVEDEQWIIRFLKIDDRVLLKDAESSQAVIRAQLARPSDPRGQTLIDEDHRNGTVSSDLPLSLLDVKTFAVSQSFEFEGLDIPEHAKIFTMFSDATDANDFVLVNFFGRTQYPLLVRKWDLEEYEPAESAVFSHPRLYAENPAALARLAQANGSDSSVGQKVASLASRCSRRAPAVNPYQPTGDALKMRQMHELQEQKAKKERQIRYQPTGDQLKDLQMHELQEQLAATEWCIRELQAS